MSNTRVQFRGIIPDNDTERDTAIDVGYETPLPVLPSTHMYAKGNIYGHEALRKFGYNGAVGTTAELIEVGGAAAPHMPTVAVSVEAISGDPADDAAGAGAQTIVVEGLDENFAPASETITMNGTSATTATTTTFIRVFRAYVATVGTYGVANTGAITVRVESAGTTFLTIAAGAGQSQTTHYCVPANMTFFIKDIHVSAETQKSSDVFFWQRQSADDVTTPFASIRLIHQWTGLAAGDDFEYQPEIVVPEKTDLWFTGAAASGTNAISVEYNGILETV